MNRLFIGLTMASKKTHPQREKVASVTGATRGIGNEIAHQWCQFCDLDHIASGALLEGFVRRSAFVAVTARIGKSSDLSMIWFSKTPEVYIF